MPGFFMRTASLWMRPSSAVGVKPSTYWLCSSCATRVKVGGELACLLQLEIAAAGFVGHFSKTAVGFALDHLLAVESSGSRGRWRKSSPRLRARDR